MNLIPLKLIKDIVIKNPFIAAEVNIFEKIVNVDISKINGLGIDFAGTKYWFKNGVFHRDDGPAIESANGNKSWFKNGLAHREDGPAICLGNWHHRYFLKGVPYSKKEFYNLRLVTLILRLQLKKKPI